MFNRIIIEGPDGVGKSTIARKINEILGTEYSVIHMRGRDVMDRNFIEQSLKKVDAIWDRQFVSENIYSDLYGMDRRLTQFETDIFVDQCKEENIPILIVIPAYRDFGPVENEDEFIKDKYDDLVDSYKNFAKEHKIKLFTKDINTLTKKELLDILGSTYEEE